MDDLRVVAFAIAAMAVVWPRRRSLQAIVAAAGGVVLVGASWHASFAGRSNDWAAVAVVGLAVALWWAIPVVHRMILTPGVSWVLLGGCAAAAYGCVPETGQLHEVGVVLACGGVAELLRWRRLPVSALAAAAALVMWAAVFGATGAPRALVGGLFAVVPVVGTAAVVSLGRRRLGDPQPTSPQSTTPQPTTSQSTTRLPFVTGSEVAAWAVAAVWVVTALVVARTGGIANSVGPALVSVALAVPVATLLSASIWRRYGRASTAG